MGKRCTQTVLLFLFVMGCARPQSRIDYDLSLTRIQRVAATGEYIRAADELVELVRSTYLEQDRVSLRLRAVDWYLMAERPGRALSVLEELRTQVLDRDSAGLVRLRYARIARDFSPAPQAALRMYLKIMVENFETVAARLALKECRTILWSPGDQEPWLRFLKVAETQIQDKNLRSLVHYHLALAFIQLDRRDEAMKIIKDIFENRKATSVWSSATGLLLRMHRSNDDAKAEASVLEFLAGHVEPTGIFSSGDALSRRGEIRLAELYCSRLQMPEKGARMLSVYGRRYPDSSLRDDALWQLAECYTTPDKRAQRERVLCRLVRDHGKTRYARRARTELGLPMGDGPGGSGPTASSPIICGDGVEVDAYKKNVDVKP